MILKRLVSSRSLFKKSFRQFDFQTSWVSINSIKQKLFIKYMFSTLGRKKKRIYQLKPTTVKLDESLFKLQEEKVDQSEYFKMKPIIDTIQWRDMPLDQLCSLDQNIIDAIQLDLKKNKFNVSDQLFKKPVSKSYQNLNRYYKKVYSLLKNKNNYYQQFLNQHEDVKLGYLHQMYVTDLKNDLELKEKIGRFIKHISNPVKLDGIVEPTFIKHLLSLKRQLLLQGIHFQSQAQKIKKIKNKENIKESGDVQQLPEIKILQIINYEYQFWQGIKHNRAKNGQQQNFIVQTLQIKNPNDSLVLIQLYPTIKVKYIIRKKKQRFIQRNFAVKCDLLIEIDGKHKRKIKIQWKGPSDKKQKPIKNTKNNQKFDEQQENQEQSNEEYVGKIGYSIIDYEGIYNGNPTIKSVFSF